MISQDNITVTFLLLKNTMTLFINWIPPLQNFNVLNVEGKEELATVSFVLTVSSVI